MLYSLISIEYKRDEIELTEREVDIFFIFLKFNCHGQAAKVFTIVRVYFLF